MTPRTAALMPTAADWHRLECGAYEADLPVWELLSASSPGTVLDLGCGTGRVATALATAGRTVTAVDSDDELLADLRERASVSGLPITCVRSDVRRLDSLVAHGLAIAPMQLIQLLGGAEGRAAALESVAGVLAPGAVAAFAMVDVDACISPVEGLIPQPDEADWHGGRLSSQPLAVRRSATGIEVERVRRVEVEGMAREWRHVDSLDELDPGSLEREATRSGFVPKDRIEIPPTPEHVGSTIVVVERGP